MPKEPQIDRHSPEFPLFKCHDPKSPQNYDDSKVYLIPLTAGCGLFQFQILCILQMVDVVERLLLRAFSPVPKEQVNSS